MTLVQKKLPSPHYEQGDEDSVKRRKQWEGRVKPALEGPAAKKGEREKKEVSCLSSPSCFPPCFTGSSQSYLHPSGLARSLRASPHPQSGDLIDPNLTLFFLLFLCSFAFRSDSINCDINHISYPHFHTLNLKSLGVQIILAYPSDNFALA